MSTDPEHKFELALSLGELQKAKQLAEEADVAEGLPYEASSARYIAYLFNSYVRIENILLFILNKNKFFVSMLRSDLKYLTDKKLASFRVCIVFVYIDKVTKRFSFLAVGGQDSARRRLRQLTQNSLRFVIKTQRTSVLCFCSLAPTVNILLIHDRCYVYNSKTDPIQGGVQY